MTTMPTQRPPAEFLAEALDARGPRPVGVPRDSRILYTKGEPMTATTDEARATLPPIECAPWCEHKGGVGHTAYESPEDQYCSALSFEISLARDPELLGDRYFRRSATVDLERDAFSDPFISAYIPNGKLTLDEAEQLATRMLEQVQLARGGAA